tara:strand:- start:102 stop:2561 length:2460 start_codon:yes stop_codon:yes gene_type:complete
MRLSLKIYLFIFLPNFLLAQDTYDTTLVILGLSNFSSLDSKYPSIGNLLPNGGENFNSGENISVSWDTSDDSLTDNCINIFISYNLGENYNNIFENISNEGQMGYQLEDINSQFVRLKITADDYYGNSSTLFSENYFTVGYDLDWDFEPPDWQDPSESTHEVFFDSSFVTGFYELDSKYPVLNILCPNGGEVYESGENISVNWNAIDETFTEEAISIYFSESLGNNFDILYGNISNSGSMAYNLPLINSAFARFKLSAIDSYGNQSIDIADNYIQVGTIEIYESDYSFEVVAYDTLFINNDLSDIGILDSDYPDIEWLYPNGGEQFDNNETITAQWVAEDDSFGDEAISIFLAEELGGYFNTIAMNIPNTDSLEVELPDANSAFSRMKITAIDTFGNTSTDYGDGYFAIGDPFNDYTVDEYEDMVIVDWNWGAHHTVFIEPSALSIFDSGTEIHIIDQNGLNQKECSFDPTYGLVSAGQYMYIGSESQLIAVNSVASTINCNADQSYSWNYMNTGETPEFVIYDQSENEFYNAHVSGNEPFSNFAFVELDTVSSTTEIITPFSIEFNQSSQQAFYFVINAFSNDLPLTVDDWIIAMRDDVVVGARQWTGPWTDVPAMGNEGSIQKIGYVSEHQIFIAVIDEVTGLPVYYDVNYSEGTGVFGENLTVIESISLNSQSTIQSDGFLNFSEDISSETREEYQFNIYRNEQLLISNYSSQIFFDDEVQTGGSYCYRIVLLDIQGEEFITSLEQCVDPTVSQCALPGDTNIDGLLNVLDVVSMVSHILGNSTLTDEQLSCADFNQDNTLNVLDVVTAVAIILGN